MKEAEIIRLARRENGYVITDKTPELDLQLAQHLITSKVLVVAERFNDGHGVRLRAVK